MYSLGFEFEDHGVCKEKNVLNSGRTLVMKFGGDALATPEHFCKVAECVKERFESYDHLIVVVSAMGSMTDGLIKLASQVSPAPLKREQDMLISVGERISMSLLAMALSDKKVEAVSLTGSQSGILTSEDHLDARIVNVRPVRLKQHLSEGKVVIVAGFQGVSLNKEITTLGRGGSDTTAVALGSAFGVEKVEFYKDVRGFYSSDPKKFKKPTLFSSLSFEKALSLAEEGHAPLHPRAILLALKNHLPLHVLSFKEEERRTFCGTMIEDRCVLTNRKPVYETDEKG